ncbi:hypothetical protein DFH09DRAFT_1326740 [Mycena vulgaris]|nr:hypothetical protein DFH09DRAFT_1326740 [Mycena vulgaris]
MNIKSNQIKLLLPRLSQSKDSLERSLRNQPMDVAECNRSVDELEGCINTVTEAFARGHFDYNSPHTESSPLIRELLEDARHTLWDTIPVYAIANAHKERAEALILQGNIEGGHDHLSKVYIEYAKYLMLHPASHNLEYIGTRQRVAVLEATMARTFNLAHGRESPPSVLTTIVAVVLAAVVAVAVLLHPSVIHSLP